MLNVIIYLHYVQCCSALIQFDYLNEVESRLNLQSERQTMSGKVVLKDWCTLEGRNGRVTG